MSTDLDPLLKRLHLAHARRAWRSIAERAEKEEWSYEHMLFVLFSEEIAHRRGTRLTKATRAAHFPFLRTIEEFDFSFQSTLRLTSIGSLLSPDFVTEGRSVILVGKPGRGKTHLAISVAYRALQHGFEVLFTTAAALIEDLSTASREGCLREALTHYVRPHVLVVDEVGYLTYGDDAANVLYHPRQRAPRPPTRDGLHHEQEPEAHVGLRPPRRRSRRGHRRPHPRARSRAAPRWPVRAHEALARGRGRRRGCAERRGAQNFRKEGVRISGTSSNERLEGSIPSSEPPPEASLRPSPRERVADAHSGGQGVARSRPQPRAGARSRGPSMARTASTPLPGASTTAPWARDGRGAPSPPRRRS
ncbi:MAG: ATP-binding protein [Polyangiaceae bacterium]|nr:ATP-binding protein [Polyangiaceae bacterium]